MRKADLSQWKRGIIVLGGDGILYEIINGLMERADWCTVLQTITLGIVPCGSGNGLAKSISHMSQEPHDQNPVLVSTLNSILYFSIVPCGSGNGLAKSISHMSQEPHDQNPVLVSTLNIVQGVSTPMDLIRAQTKSQVVFSFLSIGWGLLADIDIESERIRAVGSQRFAIWSVARLIGLRTYQGTLSYLPVPEHKLAQHRKRAVSKCMSTQSLNFMSTQRLRTYQGTLSYLRVPEHKLAQHRKRAVSKCMSTQSLNFMSPLPSSKSFHSDSIDLETEAPRTDCSISRHDSFHSVHSAKSSFHSTGAGSSYQSLHELGPVTMYGPSSQLRPCINPCRHIGR
ncbi:hypothetical protein M8J76_013577 [Diaphorina citri]|nr:hypothetical protein M8J76_013577 [Diaphorina citri]